MPSKAMIYYKVGLYMEQSDEVEKISEAHQISTMRLIRQALLMVLNDPVLLSKAISKSKVKQYRKTGLNRQ